VSLVGSGIIGPGVAEYFDVVLRAEQTYLVHVNPFEVGVDFDLHIYDENGNLISEDVSAASDAYCAVTPRWTGPFRMVVESARGASAFRIEVVD
jgi:hypothetical protein